MKKKILSMLLLIAMLASAGLNMAACKDKDDPAGSKKDTLVLMTENLDGLFNPFFSTSAADGTIVSMTQIGMLSSKLNANNDVEVAFGQNEATATLDFSTLEIKEGNTVKETVYTFVLKNGVKFSDGHPLTMEDVLFNLYIYLDPVYTGSATIYSTDIKGLAEYRNQQFGIDNDSDTESETNEDAAQRAENRIMTLIQLYWDTSDIINDGSSTTNVTYAQMVDAIKKCNMSSKFDYLSAVATPENYDKVTYQYLLDDYELALKYFKEELESDFKNAKENYTEDPYKSHPEFQNEVFCFMFMEGFVEPVYEKIAGTNRDDKSKIKEFTYKYDNERITTKEQAIDKVYNDTVTLKLDQILTGWATASKLTTEFTAKAKEVILRENSDGDTLLIPNISGIVSLGHTTDTESVTVNGKTYKVAQTHNADGTPVNADEYDVLQITINGVDPKAQWNFAFTVAPQHYYGSSSYPVDIKNNKFGIEYASFDYMKNVLQTPDKNKLPMGAGAYKVTDRDNNDNPDRSKFFDNNIVYFKANTYFNTVGTGLNNAKIEKVRYQIVSASNALAALEEGSVDYITPQYSKDNYIKISNLEKTGKYESLVADQLGYGYIGINASKITNIYIRKAIMSAMNTALALEYYASGTASQIYWPMSKVSWAYPDGESDNITNGKDYPQAGGKWNEALAEENILKYMGQAGVSAGSSELKFTFTIAGSNIQDHPCYKVFRDAAALLNKLGWEITVEPDIQALTKLSSGSLTVWAAAWGSSLDPDMYQVYHKNSTATSVLAWGYPHLTKNGTDEEKEILNELSEKIEEARETTDTTVRSQLYKEAMGYVLDLAIELPVYQRSTVYVYNTNVINPDSVPDQSAINPYSSPLDRIWELEFKN